MVGVRVEGLREFQRALRKADRDLATAVRVGFRAVAADVAADARQIAEHKGLRVSGDLIRGIRPFSRIGAAGVRSTAVHGGFAYPKRLEYENRGSSRFGPNASLLPAVDQNEERIEAGAAGVLDRIVDDLGQGGTPL